VSHQHLTNFPNDPLLDLDPWVGQRQASFRFDLTNGVTGEVLGQITPIRSASLTHDTNRTIKRQLDFDLGIRDMAEVNTITDRVSVFMVFPDGTEYPMGRYMFTDSGRTVTTAGRLGNLILNDEMFLVDQQIEVGIQGTGKIIPDLIREILASLPVTFSIEPTQFEASENWGIGSNRGQILETLSVSGDYFSPWFTNSNVLTFIRTFNPADLIPDFDWDTGNKVIRAGIVESDDLLTAPNRFIVISNAANNPGEEVVGTADVPPTAPNSVVNRGFVIANVQDLQLADSSQATAVANGIAQRMTTFEQISISTAPDPRHDSYNIINWQDEHWLELAWSMQLMEGRPMSHLLRKSYT
jgi:hypothetical protein